MTDTPTIERLPLEHPLPKEIQQMPKDDTVCKFCGVSYLVHREVKELEKKLEKVQAELEKYKGIEERERVLKAELEKLKDALTEKEKIIQDRDSSIQHLKTDIKIKEDELWKAIQQAEAAQRQLEAQKDTNNKLKKWKAYLLQQLPQIKASINKEKNGLATTRRELEEYYGSMKDTSQKLTGVIQRVCKKEKQVVDGIMSRATAAEKLSASLQTQLAATEERIAASSIEGQRLHEVESRLKEKERECSNLRAAEEQLQAELRQAAAESRNARSEAIQFKELLKNKTQEVEDLQRQYTKREQFSTNTVNKLQEELRSRAEEAQQYQRELNELREKEEERRRRAEATVITKMEASAKEMKQMQEALEYARRESSSLREEREAMVASHQHRIEQLKESFAQRLKEADGWPEKLNEVLGKERSRHAEELASLERELQKSFQVDLEIQKQRNEELILKYRQDLENAETKFKSSSQHDKEMSKAKMLALERELAEARKLAAGKEKSLREEIESLQRIISELRKGLEDGDRRNDGLIDKLQAELKEAEQDLSATQKDKQELEQKLEQSKEEIAFLQETVHRECEERYELTEALSKAREQLLIHQRGSSIAGNNYSHQERSNSKLSLGQEANQRRDSPQSPHQPSSPKTSLPLGNNNVRRSSVGSLQSTSVTLKLSTDGSSGRPPPGSVSPSKPLKGIRGGGGSMNDSRNRIASVLGKK